MILEIVLPTEQPALFAGLYCPDCHMPYVAYDTKSHTYFCGVCVRPEIWQVLMKCLVELKHQNVQVLDAFRQIQSLNEKFETLLMVWKQQGGSTRPRQKKSKPSA